MSSRLDDLVLLQRCGEMIIYGRARIVNWPRREQRTLGQSVELLMFEIEDLIIEAAKARSKAPVLHLLDARIESLKRRLLLAHNTRLITIRQFELWAGLAQELGRMAGAWLRRVR